MRDELHVSGNTWNFYLVRIVRVLLGLWKNPPGDWDFQVQCYQKSWPDKITVEERQYGEQAILIATGTIGEEFILISNSWPFFPSTAGGLRKADAS
jgi:hypothetical protein